MKVFTINKRIGETPLQALERFRRQRKISAAAKLTYIGRLDPMASGVLLVLQDATQADREKYMRLDKEYEAKILFGFETDTYDLLGIPKFGKFNKISERELDGNLLREGSHLLAVPPYSSVPYGGKPLFEWARAGKLKEKDLPKREMGVIRLRQGFSGPSERVKDSRIQRISSRQLLKYIQTNIKKVKGDFRQEEILKAWKKLLARNNDKFQILNIKLSVSSGTYIRSIAHDLGKKLKTGAVVFSLERTRVGRYKIVKSVK